MPLVEILEESPQYKIRGWPPFHLVPFFRNTGSHDRLFGEMLPKLV